MKKKMVKARIITRADASSIFYNEAKLKKFYNGKPPNSVTLAEVHNRLELFTKEGKRRIVQGVAVYR